MALIEKMNSVKKLPVARDVELRVEDFTLFAKSERTGNWVPCDTGWFLESEYCGFYVIYENPDDPEASKFSPSDWALLSPFVQDLMISWGVRKVTHEVTRVQSHATIKNGRFYLDNFRWIDHKCFADVYKF